MDSLGQRSRCALVTVVSLSLAAICSVQAQSETNTQEIQNPPGLQPVDSVPPPPPMRSGEVLEPVVTLVHDSRGLVREYRVGGRLVAVKISPGSGAPEYYLVDADGDGQLETRRNDFGSDIMVNSWLIFSWN